VAALCRPAGREGVGLENDELVRTGAALLSAAPLTYSLRRDDSDFGVFCCAKSEEGRPSPSASVGEVANNGQPAVTLLTVGEICPRT
jgi:hypothetical protein